MTLNVTISNNTNITPWNDCGTDYPTTTGGYITDVTQWTYPPVTKEMVEDDIYYKARFQGFYEDKPLKKERKVGMETLYQVIVVTKDREVLLETKIVAEDEGEAKLGVDIHSVLKEKSLKLKDVTILCNELGDVKVRKEVQKVKVVDIDDE